GDAAVGHSFRSHLPHPCNDLLLMGVLHQSPATAEVPAERRVPADPFAARPFHAHSAPGPFAQSQRDEFRGGARCAKRSSAALASRVNDACAAPRANSSSSSRASELSRRSKISTARTSRSALPDGV